MPKNPCAEEREALKAAAKKRERTFEATREFVAFRPAPIREEFSEYMRRMKAAFDADAAAYKEYKDASLAYMRCLKANRPQP